ncbi:hypothetical protein HHL22_18260 [Hymenobacter sp. RP-2-7]|uniref:Uncharacterized protein n=1 Tax=Hymenobacter polaris TaxID=2682546 RepID=A0A7Y0FNN4_9BACT|nr:hypothetical protein [Hymenobacter polaris]NML67152.1 hypothetical protein [Hymenobacter polaris]
MARSRPATLAPRLRQRLLAYRWRRVGGLAAISLALSLGLVAYLFGWSDHFVSRLLTAFLVGFCLLAVTFLGALPFISWAAAHWFGPGWASAESAPARRPAAGRSRPAGRRPITTT